MAGNYDANTYLDPKLNALRGRGGRAVGGTTYLGAAPVPQSVAPAGGTRLSTARRRQNVPLGSLTTGTAGGFSMGRRREPQVSGQRTPSTLNSDAYFKARGSGLDWLESYGPNRSQASGLDLGGASYGGRSVPAGPQSITNSTGTRSRSGNQVIDFTTGQNLDASNPYTALTGDSVYEPVNDTSPEGRYNQMSAEQDMLAAEGLEAGRAAAAEVRNAQIAPQGAPIAQTTTPSGTGRLGVGRYGVGSVYPYGGGLRKSFGPTGASSPEQMRQDELGERAIASRNRAGISTKSLLEDARKRYGLTR